MDVQEIFKSMPKVELHAHLNGSISDATLLSLTGERAVESGAVGWLQGQGEGGIVAKPNRSLPECFEIFRTIHEVIRTPKILYSVTREVIRDFARENVVYLELRTTPKRIHEISSKEEYLESVVQAILDSGKAEKFILVKLLVSIDRKLGPLEGAENVELAGSFSRKYPNIVLGMDLSGDPTKGSCEWIIPLLDRARKSGLPLSVHLPEVVQLEETRKMLEFLPERVGHGLYLHPSLGGTQDLWEFVKRSKIPIEACISSNVISGVTESLESHYVKLLHEDQMPYVICTDDSGVFNTTLSTEYLKFLEIIPIPLQELKDLCLKSIDYSFASKEEKNHLREIMMGWWAKNDKKILP